MAVAPLPSRGLPRSDLVPSCLPPSRSGFLCADRSGGGRMDRPGELGVAAQPVAVAPDVDDVAAVQDAVQKRCRHHLVSQDLAPFLEALVRGQHRRGPLVAPVHQLEEQNRSALADRKVADLIHHQERRIGQGLETVVEPTRRLRFLQG